MQNSKAQIIATIGPASKSSETLSSMIGHQMDVARLNFSWGTYEEHESYIKTIRDEAQKLGKHVPIIQDLSGPRIQNENGHQYDPESIEVLTEKDLRDLEFGLSQNIDYVALSFVGSGADIEILRSQMQKLGKVVPIIAKIERKKAIENVDDIIEKAEAVMIARGDLGNEIPLEQIPFIERDIIQKCNAAKKPVIVATQMMFSMTENALPTRAEVTDVAFAIVAGADAVMLSEETASGKYPIETVAMMERIVLESEKYLKRVTYCTL